jgi:putative glutamine amidotransferase
MMFAEESLKVINSKRPRIGITMRYEVETNRFYLGRGYSEAIEASGGIPVHIPLIPNSSYISSLMYGLDGVLLPGSASDVDPFLYGQEPHLRLGAVHTLRDKTDLLLLQEIERSSKPLLAICYGIQILNVSRGGTLIQDIASQVSNAIKHEQSGPREYQSHRVNFADGSRIANLAGRLEAMVNSHHHQAVDKIGFNLRATAWSSDTVVEALEDSRPDRYAVAVQWHPEEGWEKDSLSRELFNDFISAARLTL